LSLNGHIARVENKPKLSAY